MMLVRHAMALSPVTATPDLNAGDAAGLMAAHDIGVLPIVDGDRFVGLVTDRDLVVRVLAARKDPRTVRLIDIATTKELTTVTPDTQLCDARALMGERRIRRLPVVKDDRLLGTLKVSRGSLVWPAARGCCESPAPTCSPPTSRASWG